MFSIQIRNKTRNKKVDSGVYMVYKGGMMKRVQIYLTLRLIGFLRSDAKRFGISVSEMIRRILDEYYNRGKK